MKPKYGAVVMPVMALTGCLFAACLAMFRPGYLNNQYLAALVFLQVMVAALWRYQERFFPLLMMVFLWAGTAFPLQEVWVSGRWVVLSVGAIAGLAVYMRDRDHHFGLLHLLALFCALAAVVSAVSSLYPTQALLKAISLVLLFLYGVAGARLAVARNPERFFEKLLLFCEVLTYFTAVVYLIFQLPIFGSTNSLGAVMGVVVVPLLLWGVLIEDRKVTRQRRIFALLLALFLLFFSVARAGIVAGPLACALLFLALQRYKLLLKGILIAVVLAGIAATITSFRTADADSAASLFLYKGHRADGILGSRRTPWDETLSVIREDPWFGSGFGTSVNQGAGAVAGPATRFATNTQTLREHGNSYLAILEWVGLLGVTPFCALLLAIVVYLSRSFFEVRRTGSARHIAVPIAMVLASGLIHAMFEDWLFAPGYYLCVFFWAFAFSLADFLPSRMEAAAVIRRYTPQFSAGYANFSVHR